MLVVAVVAAVVDVAAVAVVVAVVAAVVDVASVLLIMTFWSL